MPFTLTDTLFVAFAAVDLIAVGIIGFVAMKLLETAKKGQQTVEPALNEAKAVADVGKAIADRVREDGTATARRVKVVLDRVKHRVEHTKRVVQELKPGGQETGQALQIAGEKSRQAVHTARSVGDIAQRLGRLRTAAHAAADAARDTH
jgi:uncharacterized membrane-anchored protein YhcB (DUF1043 family)